MYSINHYFFTNSPSLDSPSGVAAYVLALSKKKSPFCLKNVEKVEKIKKYSTMNLMVLAVGGGGAIWLAKAEEPYNCLG